MSSRTVEQVDDWDAVAYDGGYGGLRDLASEEFSGVVVAGPTRLVMIRGTVVGVLDGSIEDFEGVDGTARQAPHPALPLLALMQARSEEVRAKYYTEDTPVGSVDETLSSGGFTGYVELSENVLSGDYYLVYHQGRSMSVAYVGTSERLITDDEAFDQADDEVGIYEVRPVELEPVSIPEPADGTTDESAGGDSAGATDDVHVDGEDEPPETREEVSGEAGGADLEDSAASAGTESAAEAGAEAGTSTDAADPAAGGRAPDTADDATTATAERTPTDAPTADAPVDDAQSDADPSTRRDSDPETGAGTTPEAHTESDRRVRADDPDQRDTSDQRDTPDQRDPSSRSGQPDTGRTSQSDASTGQDASTTQGTATGQDTGGAGPGRTDDHPAATTGTGTSSSPDTGRQPANDATGDPDVSSRQTDTGPDPGTTQADPAASTTAGSSGGTAADLETRSIPSLNPSRTRAASRETTSDTTQTAQRARSGRQAQQSDGPKNPPGTTGNGQSSTDGPPTDERPDGASPDRATEGEPQSAGRPTDRSGQEARGAGGNTGGEPTESASEVRTELAERERELSELREDLQAVEAERDDLVAERDDLQAERDRLESELADARTEIERLEERLADFSDEGAAASAETQLSAREAVDRTNLFVRYRSKGDATLESAHAGNTERAAVDENLRLEYHTQFDADSAAVGSAPFDDFLTGTVQYRFVDWLVGSLLYEIRDTGHTDAMADLYDALPKIDRAELNGQVSVQYAEDGEEQRSQEQFDVVVRDRMGNPLVVANINDTRDPATDSMMTDLVRRAERVGESSDTLAGAILVTESFFEPEALETADEATTSGLLSRDKRRSFVNLSRKDGYHLCLVEARNAEFHLAVPEL